MNLPAALLSSVGFGFGTAAGPCNRKKTKEQAELQSAALYRDDNCSNALSLSLSSFPFVIAFSAANVL